MNLPNCPKCNSEYTYEDGNGFVCPECSHEWTLESGTESSDHKKIIKDANGNVLNDGDTVTIIVNVNEFLYHLTLNLFTSSDSEKVYHFSRFDNEIVYHLAPKYREILLMQNSPSS